MTLNPIRQSRAVLFDSALQRGDNEVAISVSAVIYWSSGMDERGYESGYVVEDLIARAAIVPIELSKEEIESLKEEALSVYLESN